MHEKEWSCRSKQQADSCDLHFRTEAGEAKNVVWKLIAFGRPRQPPVLIASVSIPVFFPQTHTHSEDNVWGCGPVWCSSPFMRRSPRQSLYLILNHHPQRTGPWLSSLHQKARAWLSVPTLTSSVTLGKPSPSSVPWLIGGIMIAPHSTVLPWGWHEVAPTKPSEEGLVPEALQDFRFMWLLFWAGHPQPLSFFRQWFNTFHCEVKGRAWASESSGLKCKI